MALRQTRPDAAQLAQWLAGCPRLAVLTGAGVSTASGIPDYRDEAGGWKRKPPVQFREFLTSLAVRQRYWARSLVGWRYFAAAQPNAAHRVLAQLEAHGLVRRLITQNVDGLHQRAGSRRVIDLHGRLDTVECLGCGARFERAEFQSRLETLNPACAGEGAGIAPDGDADIEEAEVSRFQVPDCGRCGGILKPAVVFFGETVPRERSERALAAVREAQALLVVGSSLMVWSGFRLVRAAAERGIPVVAINRGRTRADALFSLKLDGNCGAWLDELARRLAC